MRFLFLSCLVMAFCLSSYAEEVRQNSCLVDTRSILKQANKIEKNFIDDYAVYDGYYDLDAEFSELTVIFPSSILDSHHGKLMSLTFTVEDISFTSGEITCFDKDQYYTFINPISVSEYEILKTKYPDGNIPFKFEFRFSPDNNYLDETGCNIPAVPFEDLPLNLEHTYNGILHGLSEDLNFSQDDLDLEILLEENIRNTIDIFNGDFQILVGFLGPNKSHLHGKLVKFSYEIPGIKNAQWTQTSCVPRQEGFEVALAVSQVSPEVLLEIISLLKNKNKIPIKLKVEIGKTITPGLCHQDAEFQLDSTVYEGTQYLKSLISYQDQTIQVGLVQILPKPINFKKTYLCLFLPKDLKNNRKFGTVVDRVVTDKPCKKYLRSKEYYNKKTIWQYSLDKLFYSKKNYTTVPYAGKVDENGKIKITATHKIYSFKEVEDYWPRVLKSHGISKDVYTYSGQNPKFKLNILPPVVASKAPQGYTLFDIITFVNEEIKIHKLDLSPYDYIANVVYNDLLTSEFGFRSFADLAGGPNYNSFSLDAEDIVNNQNIFILIHEAGHQYFRLIDKYNDPEFGLGGKGDIQFPIGVPDPSQAKQDKACVMADYGFGHDFADEISVYSNDPVNKKGLSKSMNMSNFILCSQDIEELSLFISDPINPKCHLNEFFDLECGACTAENYLSCYRCGNSNQPGCDANQMQFSVSGQIKKRRGNSKPLLEKARVFVRDLNTKETIELGFDANTGEFTFPALPGRYKIKVRFQGKIKRRFKVRTKRITVADKNLIEQDLYITRKKQ